MQWNIFLNLYVISLPVFFIIDLLWIGLVANTFYNTQIGHLRGPISWPAAIAFYTIFLAGVTYFATYPAVMSGGVGRAVLLGALFGFFTYATYNLTNMSTLKDWPLLMTVVDMTWGVALGAAVAGISVFFYSLLG